MACRGGRLRVLAWLLLCARVALFSLPSRGGVQDPGTSPGEPPGSRMPGVSSVPRAGDGVTSHGSVTFTPSYSHVSKTVPYASPPPWVTTTACGHRTPRILGGQPAPQTKWPWQVSLQVNRYHICGGSLISKRWVLTAAHCIYGNIEYMVMLGETNLRSRRPIMIPVADVVIYRDYSSLTTLVHDIALVLLSFPVDFSPYIQPVCLPEKTLLVQAGTPCWVTGWGRKQENAIGTSKYLQEVELYIIRQEECNDMLREQMNSFFDIIGEGTICAYSQEGKDACQGDSGGPMVCEFNKTWVQIGIVSWGVGCGRIGYPGIYTEVSFYRDWVITELSGASHWDLASFLVVSLCLLLHLGLLVTL